MFLSFQFFGYKIDDWGIEEMVITKGWRKGGKKEGRKGKELTEGTERSEMVLTTEGRRGRSGGRKGRK